MNGASIGKMLDLTDVNLVDITVVRFLICGEDEGVELVQCPPYLREWMTRERARKERQNRCRRQAPVSLNLSPYFRKVCRYPFRKARSTPD